MISPTPTVRAPSTWRLVFGAVVVMLLGAPSAGDAQVVQGVQQGAAAGNKAAGPVGGGLGGAVGGGGRGFSGGLGVGQNGRPPPADKVPAGAKQSGASKNANAAKSGKETKQAPVLTQQQGEPQLTAE